VHFQHDGFKFVCRIHTDALQKFETHIAHHDLPPTNGKLVAT
jgi:hypothetical protein